MSIRSLIKPRRSRSTSTQGREVATHEHVQPPRNATLAAIMPAAERRGRCSRPAATGPDPHGSRTISSRSSNRLANSRSSPPPATAHSAPVNGSRVIVVAISSGPRLCCTRTPFRAGAHIRRIGCVVLRIMARAVAGADDPDVVRVHIRIVEPLGVDVDTDLIIAVREGDAASPWAGKNCCDLRDRTRLTTQDAAGGG